MLFVFQMQLDDMPGLNLAHTLRIMWRELRSLPILLINAHLRERHVNMEFDTDIRVARSNPQQLEAIYQLARRNDQAETFRMPIAVTKLRLIMCCSRRGIIALQNGAEVARKAARQTNWLIAAAGYPYRADLLGAQ